MSKNHKKEKKYKLNTATRRLPERVKSATWQKVLKYIPECYEELFIAAYPEINEIGDEMQGDEDEMDGLITVDMDGLKRDNLNKINRLMESDESSKPLAKRLYKYAGSEKAENTHAEDFAGSGTAIGQAGEPADEQPAKPGKLTASIIRRVAFKEYTNEEFLAVLMGLIEVQEKMGKDKFIDKIAKALQKDGNYSEELMEEIITQDLAFMEILKKTLNLTF